METKVISIEVPATLGTILKSMDSKTSIPPIPADAEKKLYELIPVAGGAKRIRLSSDELRYFIYQGMDVNIVPRKLIVSAGDSAIEKARLRQAALFNLTDFFGVVSEFENVKPEELEGYGLTWESFSEFVSMLKSEKDEYCSATDKDFAEGSISFEGLAVYLNVPKRMISFNVEGNPLAMIISNAEIQQGFMGPPSLVVKGTILVNMGKGFTRAAYKVNLPYFSGKIDPKLLGVQEVAEDESLKNRLIERGEKYLKVTSNPCYMAYTGVILRRAWWSNNRYKAKGRVMVDIMAMRNIDPNYEKYIGFNRYQEDNEAEISRLNAEDFTEEMKICTPPFVYGFSFSAKQWGEMVLDEISDINFRTDAFDKLVLDADTKDIVFSLVNTKYNRASTDLIDGKGGGCIFLLEGPPGVGNCLTSC